MKSEHINSSADSYINSLVESGTPHIMTVTGGSTTVKIDDGPALVFSSVDLTPYELGFIGMVKREVISAAENLRLPERKPTFYHIYPFRPAGGPHTLTEVDISSAYWDTAFREGLLSPRVFEAGERVRKPVRLIALGAAAAVRRTFIFDGKEYTDATEETNEWGRRAYFYVASKVSGLCRQVCDTIPGAAVLYWVDAVVCLPAYADQVKRLFFEAGFTFKTKPLIDCYFEISATGEKKWQVIESDSGRIKEFRQFPRRRNFEIMQTINRNFGDLRPGI